MDRKNLTGKERKSKRKEDLTKKRVVEELVKTAYSKDDHLLDFPAFLKYERHGLELKLESGKGNTLSSSLKQYIQALLKLNMEGPYGHEWPKEEKAKRRHMVETNARYIIVRTSRIFDSPNFEEHLWCGPGDPVVAFVQFRFLLEEDIPVLYLYELQLEKCVQKKGLGKFLMRLLELIACKNSMKALMLTVQKDNTVAVRFYKSMRYVVSSISPSRLDTMIGVDKSYEILCKTFDFEAKSKLEEALVCSNKSK